MRLNLVGAFIRNAPFGTEIAFKKGFERIGCQVTAIDPDYPDQRWDHGAEATVVFKWLEGPHLEELETFSGKKIVYQPDDVRFPHISRMMSQMRDHCDYALTYDDEMARKCESVLGYRKAEKLLLTADDELYRPLPGKPRDVDACFIGSLTGGPNHRSRLRMVELVKATGITFAVGSDVYDIGKIVELYNRSVVVLNHATDVGQPFGQGYGYQCRHFEAGMTGVCVLSNSVTEDTYELSSFERFSDERELVERVLFLTRSEEGRRLARERGERFLEEIREAHMPQHRGEQLVRFIEGLS
jgi:hypothetical protein